MNKPMSTTNRALLPKVSDRDKPYIPIAAKWRNAPAPTAQDSVIPANVEITKLRGGRTTKNYMSCKIDTTGGGSHPYVIYHAAKRR